jgi:hypothetical protein
MLMEPLAIFGLCITCLNILLNTTRQLIDVGEQLKNLEDRLKKYFECLENCQLSLQVWASTWEAARQQRDYEVLFGRTEWRRIQER